MNSFLIEHQLENPHYYQNHTNPYQSKGYIPGNSKLEWKDAYATLMIGSSFVSISVREDSFYWYNNMTRKMNLITTIVGKTKNEKSDTSSYMF